MIRVEIPEYNTFIEFPDGTAPGEIQKVMQSNFPPKQKSAPGKKKTALFSTVDGSGGVIEGDADEDVVRNTIKPIPAMAAAQTATGIGGKIRQFGEDPIGAMNRLNPVGALTSAVLSRAGVKNPTLPENAVSRFGKNLAAEGEMVQRQIEAEHPLGQGSMAQAIRSGLASTYQQLPSMVLGAGAGRMAAKFGNTASNVAATTISLIPMGETTEGATYQKLREKGFDPSRAGDSAYMDKIFEVGTELIPTARWLRMISPNSPIKQGIKSTAQQLMKYGGEEYVGEIIAAVTQGANDKFMSDPKLSVQDRLKLVDDYFRAVDPNTGMSQAFSDIWDAIKVTTVQNLAMGALGGGARGVMNMGGRRTPAAPGQPGTAQPQSDIDLLGEDEQSAKLKRILQAGGVLPADDDGTQAEVLTSAINAPRTQPRAPYNTPEETLPGYQYPDFGPKAATAIGAPAAQQLVPSPEGTLPGYSYPVTDDQQAYDQWMLSNIYPQQPLEDPESQQLGDIIGGIREQRRIPSRSAEPVAAIGSLIQERRGLQAPITEQLTSPQAQFNRTYYGQEGPAIPTAIQQQPVAQVQAQAQAPSFVSPDYTVANKSTAQPGVYASMVPGPAQVQQQAQQPVPQPHPAAQIQQVAAGVPQAPAQPVVQEQVVTTSGGTKKEVHPALKAKKGAMPEPSIGREFKYSELTPEARSNADSLAAQSGLTGMAWTESRDALSYNQDGSLYVRDVKREKPAKKEVVSNEKEKVRGQGKRKVAAAPAEEGQKPEVDKDGITVERDAKGAVRKMSKGDLVALRTPNGKWRLYVAGSVIEDVDTQEEATKSILTNNRQEEGEEFSLMSSRVPTAVKAKEDPLSSLLTIDSDVMFSDEKTLGKNVALLSGLANMKKRRKGEPIQSSVKAFIRHATDNLLWLHDLMKPEWRKRAKLLYDGGNKIAKTFAQRYGISDMQASAVIAVLSPQNDWLENVSAAERVMDAVFAMRDFRWDDAMTAESDKWEAGNKAAKEKKSEKYTPDAELPNAKGKTLGEVLNNPAVAARWIRFYDQAHNNRGFRILTPEGGSLDFSKTKGGSNAIMRWKTFDNIAKAVSILNDGRAENVFYQLGEEHKVRNFYNNLFDPNSDLGFTTIDTHAVAAANLQVLGSEDPEVLHAFGRKGSSSGFTGLRGAYAIYMAAYKQAAKERNILPREMQSITWEAVRGLFSSDYKRVFKPKVRAIWQQYKDGLITQERAQQEILKLTGGVNAPSWTSAPKTETFESTYTGPARERLKEVGKAADSTPANVTFEVAPDPDDKALSKAWNALPYEERLEISQRVAAEIIPKILEEAGTSGSISLQVGGYKGETNPSLALSVEDMQLAITVTNLCGFVLSQNEMMMTSPVPVHGADEVGVVSIKLPDGYGIKEIEALYDKLWEMKKGRKRLVGGHTTANGHMAILNYSGIDTKRFADMIDAHLGSQFTVTTGKAYAAFPGKKDYTYASDRERAVSTGSPVSQRGYHLRAEATRLLREAIDRRGTDGRGKRGVGKTEASISEKGFAGTRGKSYKRELETIVRAIREIAPKGTRLRMAESLVIDTAADASAKESLGAHGLDYTGKFRIAGSHKIIRMSTGEAFSLIRIALDHANKVETAYHEIWHSVESLLLTPTEQRIIARAFPSKDGVSQRERSAKAFAKFATGQLKGASPQVRSILQKISEFLEKLGNAMRGLGYRSARELFENTYSGKLKAEREAREAFDPEDFYVKLYHGTHDKAAAGINKDGFKLQYIGTGEGNRSFGWGLYFAEAEALGIKYRRQVAGRGMEIRIGNTNNTSVRYKHLAKGIPLEELVPGYDKLSEAEKEVFGKIMMAQTEGKEKGLDRIKRSTNDALWNGLVAKLDIEQKEAGRLFQVGIDIQDDEVLNWDVPLKDQPAKVQNALQDVVEKHNLSPESLGREIYWALSEGFGGVDEGAQAASLHLKALGIPALKYLDERSREAGEGTRNYVIFDDSKITVEEMYAVGEDSTGVEADEEYSISSTLAGLRSISPSTLKSAAKFLNPLMLPHAVHTIAGYVAPDSLVNAVNDLLATPLFYVERNPEVTEVFENAWRRQGESFAMKSKFQEYTDSNGNTRTLKDLHADFKGLGKADRKLFARLNTMGDALSKEYATLQDAQQDVPGITQEAFNHYRDFREFVRSIFPKAREEMVENQLEKYNQDPILKETLRYLINSKATLSQAQINDTVLAAFMEIKGLKYIVPEYQKKPWFDDLANLMGYSVDPQGNVKWQKPVDLQQLKANPQQFAGKISQATLADQKLLDGLIAAFKDVVENKRVDKTVKRAAEDVVERRKGLADLKNSFHALTGWMPRMREDGKYRVEVYLLDANGDPERLAYVDFRDSKFAADRLKEAVKNNPGNYYGINLANHQGRQFSDPEVAFNSRKRPESIYADRATDIATEEIINSAVEYLHNNKGLPESEMNDIRDAVMKATADRILARGAGAHKLKRAPYLIEGYQNDDPYYAMSRYIGGLSGFLSKGRYAIRQMQALSDVPGEHKDWAYNYIKNTLKNAEKLDQYGGTVRSLVTLAFLGLRVSSAIYNATQNIVYGQAELSRHTKDPIKVFAAAYRDLGADKMAKVKGKQSPGITMVERHALREAINVGAIHENIISDQIARGEGIQNKAGRVIEKAVDITMYPFQFIEQYANREPAFLAAYRVFASRNPGFRPTQSQPYDPAAFKAALDFVNKVHFLPGKANLPMWAHNAFGRTAYTLMSYVANSFNWMYNRATSGQKDQLVAMVRMLAAVSLIGGATAIPVLGDDFWKFLRSVTKVDYRAEFEKYLRESTSDITGSEPIIDAIFHGLPTFAGVNVSNAVTLRIPVLSNLLSGDGIIESATGAVGGVVQKLVKGAGAAMEGDYYRAAEYAAPEFIGGAMRAGRMATEGATTNSGKTVYGPDGKQVKYSASDVVKRTLGFQPLGQSKLSEVRDLEYYYRDVYGNKKSKASAKARKLLRAGDTVGAAKTIIEFNKMIVKSPAKALIPPFQNIESIFDDTPDKRQLMFYHEQKALLEQPEKEEPEADVEADDEEDE